MCEDKYARKTFLRVQALGLLDHDECSTYAQRHSCKDDGNKKINHDVKCKETYQGDRNGSCRPINITSLKTQELKRLLKPLEYRKIRIVNILLCHMYYFKPKNAGKA